MTASPAPIKRVPAVALRLILAGIKDVAGSQYSKVLTQAELQRYVDSPPPEDQSPTISEPELSRLYGTTYRVIGESLTRMFLTNYGRKLPAALLNGPAGLEMQKAAAATPEAKKLETAVQLIADTGTKLWVPMRVLEDQEAYYLEISHCAICAEMKGARSPICGNSEVVYTELARALSGKRVMAIEVECAAMGAPHCKYRIRK